MDARDHEDTMRAYYGARAPLMRYDNLRASAAGMLDEYAAYIGYRIIKNWPSEAELGEVLRPYARNIEFQHFERDWFVSYVAL